MADNAAVLQLHLAHQRTYRLLQRQVVKLARTQAAQQATHRVVNPQREVFNQLAALANAGVVRRQPLDDPRLGAYCGDGLANIIMELARDVAAHALFGLQQAIRQTTITRQLVL